MMKKIISIFLIVALIITSMPQSLMASVAYANEKMEAFQTLDGHVSESAKWTGGASTEWYSSNPSAKEYTISTADELAGLAKIVNDGKSKFSGKIIKLSQDLDLSGSDWTPIGKSGDLELNTKAPTAFCGTFDGKNKKITGLKIKKDIREAGLFGTVSGNCVIKDVNLSVDTVKIERAGVLHWVAAGGLVGLVKKDQTGGTIDGCRITIENSITGSTNGQCAVGGVVGVIWPEKNDFIIQNCVVNVKKGATVESKSLRLGESHAGGYVGYASGNIKKSSSYVQGTIKAETTDLVSGGGAGGMIGFSQGNPTIEDSYCISTIDAKYIVAGKYMGVGNLVGRVDGSSKTILTRLYSVDDSRVTISGNNSARGKIVGYSKTKLEFANVYAYNRDAVTDGCGKIKIILSSTTPVALPTKTKDDLKNKETFKGFDFEKIWTMEVPGSGYPIIDNKALAGDTNLVPDINWYSKDPQAKEYTIYTAQELAGLAQIVNTKESFLGRKINLGAHINLSGYNWTPIGMVYPTSEDYDHQYIGRVFQGTFDGRGKAVKGLSANGLDLQTIGLFGAISGNATIKNLDLTILSITNYNEFNSCRIVGGLVGAVQDNGEGGKIENCIIRIPGTISIMPRKEDASVGGLVGAVFPKGEKFVIQNCSVMLGSEAAIGLKCWTGVHSQVGGFAGFSAGDIKESSSRIKGIISLSTDSKQPILAISGFLGFASGGNITDSYCISAPTAIYDISGGVTEPDYQTVNSTGLGGLIGCNDTEITLKNVYSLSDVGLSSYDEKNAEITYKGKEGKGALIGYAIAKPNIQNGYYNEQLRPAVGLGDYSMIGGERTKDQLMQQATFQTYDFEKIWKMDMAGIGYPILTIDLSDEEKVSKALELIDFDAIKGQNTLESKIKTNLNLLSDCPGGAVISWQSDKPDSISNTGIVTLKPEDVKVNLTATIQSGSVIQTKQFALTVWNTSGGIDWQEVWANKDEKAWVFVGDSVSNEGTHLTRGTKSYPEYITNRLRNELGNKIRVYHVARSGMGIDTILEKADDLINKHKPDIVSIETGFWSKDHSVSNPNKPQSVEEYRSMLEKLILKIIPNQSNVASGVPANRIVLLLGSPPFNGTENVNLKSYMMVNKEIAQKYYEMGFQVQYIDLYGLLQNRIQYGVYPNLNQLSDYYCIDDSGVMDCHHPNGPGHLEIAKEIMKNVGIFSDDSQICNQTAFDITNEKKVPALTKKIDYADAKKYEGGVDLPKNITSATEFLNAVSKGGDECGNVLYLGGNVTAGFGKSDSYNSYQHNISAYIRGPGDLGKNFICGVFLAEKGDSVASINSKISDVLNKEDPKYVFLMPEVNELYDANYEHTYQKIIEYKENLKGILNACENKNIPVTILTPPPLKDNAMNGYMEEYVNVVIEVAGEKNINVCNVYNVLKDIPKKAQTSRNWYNEDGYPTGVMNLEIAKAFITGTLEDIQHDHSTPKLDLVNYDPKEEQYDNLKLPIYVKGDKLALDISSLKTDELHNITNPKMDNFKIKIVDKDKKNNFTEISFELDTTNAEITFDNVFLSQNTDKILVTVINGAKTRLPYYTKDDLDRTDKQRVDLAKNWLTWDVIRGKNDSQQRIWAHLILPIQYQGVTITWDSNCDYIGTDGTIYHNPYWEDCPGQLIATMTIGSEIQSKVFNVAVKAGME